MQGKISVVNALFADEGVRFMDSFFRIVSVG
jgi:hypothetical protein